MTANSPLSYEIGIIGGGVIGCSLARALSSRFKHILVLEKEGSVAAHTSGRNSGVIHSGFNPEPGTLKAKLCVEGNQKARAFCLEHNVPFEQVGTLVLAVEEGELHRLSELKARGEKNGVPGIQILDLGEVRRKEPRVKGVAALYSPTGGIVDSRKFAERVATEAKNNGVDFRFHEEVINILETPGGMEIQTRNASYHLELVINAAGLHSDRLAHRMGVGREYSVVPFRGEYFEMERQAPPLIHSMIYPVPHPILPFLGIHLTRTVEGSVLIGPNAVPAFGREAYRWTDFNAKDFVGVASFRGFWKAFLKNRELIRIGLNELLHSCSKHHFLKEASRLVHGLSLKGMKLASRVGIRPQLIQRNGHLVEDLIVETTARSIHILNVVSPGMTTALAFSDWLSKRIDSNLHWMESRILNAS